MSEVTPKNFLNLLKQSGLVENELLRKSLADLKIRAAGKPVSLEQLSSHLVSSGLITEWHVHKLKSGKYKGFFLGKYKLLRHLGTGGMSTVYLAQHTIFDQFRAIKVLPKNNLSSRTYLERFYREGRAAASLNHRNIVRVYDIANEGETHYLVMEYVEGQNIYEMVRQGGPLPVATTIDYAIQALTGLSHAHEHDLVHRDVKPANLLVTGDGTVKLLDLGLALFSEEDSSLTVIHNERVLGTADYLSPEQAVDSHNVDLRADIYSSGCTMYYMLAGRPPFHEGTLAQRIARHQSVNPESLKKLRGDCPDTLVAIIEKMMEKNPDDRYQSCGTLIPELRHVLESLPELTAPVAVNRKTAVDRSPAAETGSQPNKESEPAAAPQPGRSRSPAISGPAGRPPGRQPAQVAESSMGETATKAGDRESMTRSPRQTPAMPEPARSRPASTPNRASSHPTSGGKGGVATRATPAGASSPTTTAGMPPPTRARAPLTGKSPVDGATISIVAPQLNRKIDVNPSDRDLRAFVSKTGRNAKNTAKIPRGSMKNQLILAAAVLAMLVLLGLVIVIAMRLTNRPSRETAGNRPGTQDIRGALLADEPASSNNTWAVRGEVAETRAA